MLFQVSSPLREKRDRPVAFFATSLEHAFYWAYALKAYIVTVYQVEGACPVEITVDGYKFEGSKSIKLDAVDLPHLTIEDNLDREVIISRDELSRLRAVGSFDITAKMADDFYAAYCELLPE